MSQSQSDRPRFGRLGNRPLSVYGVLVIGVSTLLLLLAVIYFTASEQDQPAPVCTSIDIDRAQASVLAGEVAQITVVQDDEELTPTNVRFGPVQARIEYVSGQCAYLPQGVTERGAIYAMIGMVAFYNENTDGQSVSLEYLRDDALPAQLFETPAPPPTATLPPTETPFPTPTATAIPATPIPTRQPTPPLASPNAATPASPVPATPMSRSSFDG